MAFIGPKIQKLSNTVYKNYTRKGDIFIYLFIKKMQNAYTLKGNFPHEYMFCCCCCFFVLFLQCLTSVKTKKKVNLSLPADSHVLAV